MYQEVSHKDQLNFSFNLFRNFRLIKATSKSLVLLYYASYFEPLFNSNYLLPFNWGAFNGIGLLPETRTAVNNEW